MAVFETRKPHDFLRQEEEGNLAKASLQSDEFHCSNSEKASFECSIPIPNTSTSREPLVWPSTYRQKARLLKTVEQNNEKSILTFMTSQLDVSRLTKINQYLWLAGLEIPARALHHQIAVGLRITITEQADLHLLRDETRIFIKPLPEFLLRHSVWQDYICGNRELHENASGFLLSYLWLICLKSDFKVAHDLGLLPDTVNWETWTQYAKCMVHTIDHVGYKGINIRYRRGELRLGRVTWIYRLCPITFSFRNFPHSYVYGYHTYASFLQANLAWLVSVFVYIALVLQAMQVGLSTKTLSESNVFQNASYGFTTFAIIAPLVVFCAVVFVMLALVLENIRYALVSRRKWTNDELPG